MEDGLRQIVYSQGGVIKNKDRYVCHCIIIKINLFLNCGTMPSFRKTFDIVFCWFRRNYHFYWKIKMSQL